MNCKITTAFALAAGYGKRLKPLTDILPKPLLLVRGSSPLFMLFDKLADAGIGRIIVNTHHLAEKFDEAFAPYTANGKTVYKNAEIAKIFEPQILDTGGGIKNACALLERGTPFLVHNSDIIFTADIGRFVRAAEAKFAADPNLAAVVCLRDKGANKNVGVAGGFVRDMRFQTGAKVEKNMQFTGLFAANKKFLDTAKAFPADAFSTVDVFLRLIDADPDSVAYFEENSGTWSDIGTPAEYLKACKNDPETEFSMLAKLAEFGFAAQTFAPINKGASTRKFLRFTDAEGNRLVACFYGSQKREDALYANLARFLCANGIDVCDIVKSCGRRRIIVMTDGGENDLLSLAKQSPYNAAPFYGRAIENLRRLHTAATESYFKKPFELSQPFDEALYDWEQNYFKQECLISKFGIAPTPELDAELAEIKRVLLREKPVLLHRDFQSQNIMAELGKIKIIDFQGMRLGCALYDVASLLFDPYVDLPDEIIQDCLRLYFRATPTPEQLRLFYTAACERLMQALGAYGFLSIKKGKTEYAQYFDSAIKKLSHCATLANFPTLANIFYDS